MIDIHSHILPRIDDGAGSLDVSRAMLLAANASGIRTIVATPHLTESLDPEYAAKVGTAFCAVEPMAREVGITLERGFEIRLAPDLPARLRAGEPVTLAATHAVLVDLPFVGWPHFVEDTLFAVQTSGFLPILAHPERYPDIQRHPERAAELVRRGVVLQVTASSFAGIFGKRAKRTAETLVRMGTVHLVATDAHSAGHRMAAVPEGLRRLGALVGGDGLRRLTVEAPALLLNGEPLPRPVDPSSPTAIRRIFAVIGR